MSGFINEPKFPIKAILIGTAVGAAVMLLLLCAVTGILNMTSGVPYDFLPFILLVADAGAAFVGGYLSAAINKKNGLILGLIVGGILFVVLFVLGLSTGESIGLTTLLKAIVLTVCGMLGGIKGVNKKEKIRIK